MVSKILFKSVSTARKACNAFPRPFLHLLRSHPLSAHIGSPSSFLFKPNPFMGVSGSGISSFVTQETSQDKLDEDAQREANTDACSSQSVTEGSKTLEKYGTELAIGGKVDPVIGRHDAARVLEVESEHLMKALLAKQIFAKAGIYSALQATHDFISTQATDTDDTSSQTLGSTSLKNWFCAQLKVTGDTSSGYALVLGSSIRTILRDAESHKQKFEADFVLAFYSDESKALEKYGTELARGGKLDPIHMLCMSSVAEGCPFIIDHLIAEIGVHGIPSLHPCASKSDNESKTPAGKMEEPTMVISEIRLWELIRSVSPEMMATLIKGRINDSDALQHVNMEERQKKIEAHCISFDEKLLDSVVMIFSATTRHDSFRPWQYQGEEECNGSGFVISGKKILTNAHVAKDLSDFTFISVAKKNSTIRYKARLKKISHECDLAVLEVDSNEFWKDMSPLSFGDIPPVGEAVSVAGFPDGYNIRVTRGLVNSRKFHKYSVSDTELLVIVVDAEIISGHSGGPVIMQGKVVGVAFQSVDNAKWGLHIGSVIPTPVIMHFLSSSFEESDQHSGFGWVGLICKSMSNGSVSDSGIFVESISSLSGAHEIMETSDILLAIDNIPIGNDGTVLLRNERIDYRHLVSMKKPNENILIKLLRDGEVVECNITLKPRKPHIKVQKHYIPPSYYIFGGFVFVPFTHAYIVDAKIPEGCDDDILCKTESMAKELGTGEQLVMLSLVLRDDNHDVNQDFRRLEDMMVHKVNGVEVNNLKHLIELVEGCCTEHLRLDLQDGEVAVLHFESAKEATAGILKRYNIFFSKSENLRGSY